MGIHVAFSPCFSADTFCTPTRIYYATAVLLLAVAVPLVVYFVVVSENLDAKSEGWTCNIKVEYR